MTTVSTRTDEDIQEDVLAELRWDSRVRPNDIGVIVKNGIVTLTGWVESYSQKVAAESAAHRVRGVLAVANDIEVRLPAFAERTDADLAAAVLNALKWEADIPAGKIKVTVNQGWVTLDGEVDNILQKIDAERAVSHISGYVAFPIDLLLKSSLCQQISRRKLSKRSSVTRRPMPGKLRLRFRGVRSFCVGSFMLTRKRERQRRRHGHCPGLPRLKMISPLCSLLNLVSLQKRDHGMDTHGPFFY
ncbi:BON domain-containing protein [Dictyobacter kobayashii]|uniref:Ornithine aminotransferase n=1 Tax=Dictyobacter kobayashii TaxID=2014872 RepID=A0A402ASD0_9CHLR|nr:ornithine aminotransferase [Dictyobacter kobayashii]